MTVLDDCVVGDFDEILLILGLNISSPYGMAVHLIP